LLDFLRRTACETLYLVGDIVDGWQLRRGWYWPQTHNDVVQKLLRKVRKGTRVVFVPGNHDEFARTYLGHSFGGIEVVEDCMHLSVDGRRLWVTHGDLFDGVVQCARWLAYLGDSAYEFTLKLNRYVNHRRRAPAVPPGGREGRTGGATRVAAARRLAGRARPASPRAADGAGVPRRRLKGGAGRRLGSGRCRSAIGVMRLSREVHKLIR
jgi:UDP-2,3-diacylglucosamine pyrophosphatase LpxH